MLWGVSDKCWECFPLKKQLYTPEKKDAYFQKTYGITLAEYDCLAEYQRHVCAVCGEKDRNGKALSVDHCHVTGKVRALLCGHCNMGLGYFLDNQDRLLAAINYLKTHTEV